MSEDEVRQILGAPRLIHTGKHVPAREGDPTWDSSWDYDRGDLQFPASYRLFVHFNEGRLELATAARRGFLQEHREFFVLWKDLTYEGRDFEQHLCPEPAPRSSGD